MNKIPLLVVSNIARIADAVQCHRPFNCQVTMIVMHSDSQLSEMPKILRKFTSHVFVFVFFWPIKGL